MANTTPSRKPLRPSRYVWFVRALFLLLGVAPVLAVAALSAKHTLPGFGIAQRGEWQRELSRRLGTSVEIESIKYPAPHLARLTNLVLLNPETHKPLARIPHVDVLSTTEGFHVHCETPDILSTDIRWLQRLAERAILEMPGEELAPLTLELGDVHLPINAQQSQTLHAVQFQLTPLPEGPVANLVFHLPGEDANSVTELSLQRDRSQESPSTQWQLTTSPQGLPLALMTPFCPSANTMGDQANFRGSAKLTLAATTKCQLEGVIAPIDLDRLIAQPFRQPLAGKASLTLAESTFEDGHLVSARGAVTCSDGHIGKDLFTAAKQQLQLLTPAGQTLPTTGTMRFQHLHLGFILDQDTLALSSSSPDPAGDNVLLATRLEVLLRAPTNHRVDNAGTRIARTLIPSLDRQFPSNQQLVAFLSWLPRSHSTTAGTLIGETPTRPTARPVHKTNSRIIQEDNN